MELLVKAKTNFNKVINLKYFDELYAVVLALVALLGWSVNTILGMSILIIVAAVVLLLTNDFTYIIPCVIYSLFCINTGFNNNEIPIPIIISAVVLIIVMVIQVCKNGLSFKKMKMSYGLIGLAVFNIIPIFWANNIKPEYPIFYIFFFSNLIYLLVYVLFINGLKKDAFKMLAHTMTYLGMLIALECMIKVIELSGTVDNILKLTYFLGWGVCNEGAIMICVSMPFTFYILGSSTKVKNILFNQLKVILMLVGVLLTTSRGGIIFASIEVVLLEIAVLVVAKEKKLYRTVTLIYLGLLAFIAICSIVPLTMLVNDIMKYIFDQGLDSNGRTSLWKEAFDAWTLNPRNVILGPGITSVIRATGTANGVQEGMIVFHSTIMETLVVGGIFALIALLLHFIEKYYAIYKTKDSLLFVTMLIGFLVVDIHGMIDNTYHMYYYMVPLVIILAVINNINFENELNTL